MSISIGSELETKLRARAEAEGITVNAFLERLVRDEDEELETLALDGLNSGEPIEPGPGYWQEKHRRLDERLDPTPGR